MAMTSLAWRILTRSPNDAISAATGPEKIFRQPDKNDLHRRVSAQEIAGSRQGDRRAMITAHAINRDCDVHCDLWRKL